MAPELHIAFRPAGIADAGVVVGPWMAQLRDLPLSEPARAIFRRMGEAGWDRQHGLVERIVAGCPPLLAVHPDHHEQVFGWICGELAGGCQVLHQLYVRNMWRRRRVATRLLAELFGAGVGALPIFYSHPGKATQLLRQKWRLAFHPYLAARF